jgi:hypothetical protein
LNSTSTITKRFDQWLRVYGGQIFDDTQIDIYEKAVMEKYTDQFGDMVGEPFVMTTCKVIEQRLGSRRKRSHFGDDGSNGEPIRRLRHRDSTVIGEEEEDRFLGTKGSNRRSNRLGIRKEVKQQQRKLQACPLSPSIGTGDIKILVLTFTMTYESRYGIEVENYPNEFKTYINSNLPAVTEDMQCKFLPVEEAQSVFLYEETTPTLKPTPLKPTPVPTVSPMITTSLPTSQQPSMSPSTLISPPSPLTKQPTSGGDGELTDRTSFIVGLAAGLGGATIVVILLICYMKRKNERKNPRSGHGGGGHEAIEVISADSPVAASAMRESGNTFIRKVSESGGVDTSVVVMGGGASDSIFSKDPTIMSNPSMVSGGGSGSFSSDSDNENNLRSLQDEFDRHKNQNKELLKGLESAGDAEKMMCMAMTRALMEEDEDNMDKNQWGIGRQGKGWMDDAESIEANALCETTDWLRKNERSSADERYDYVYFLAHTSPTSCQVVFLTFVILLHFSRNAFFQQILNRMVYTVRQGLNPSDGTLAIHSCAAMLGLQLETDLPNNVILVTGLLKTKDTTQGRKYLVEAFEQFGAIESAAIASSNKGFGFVRFVHPRSVQRALEQYHNSEIEVQDVSVMIRPLKS